MPASEPGRVRRAPAYLIAGFLHAVAMLLAFPPVGLWPAALVAPLPLIWAGWVRGRDLARHGGRARLGRAVWMVSLGTAPLHLYAHQWVIDVSAFGYPFFVAIMSLMSGLFVWATSVVLGRWGSLPLALAAPVLWTGLEVLRGEVLFSGYPWLLVAHPLADAPLLPATASLLGTYFTGALMVGVAGVVLDRVLRRGNLSVSLAALAVVAVAVGAGVWLSPKGGGNPVRFAIIQTNIPQSNKIAWRFQDQMRDMKSFSDLTRRAVPGADILVWPETMFPGLTLSESGVAEERARSLTFQVPREVDPREIVPSTDFYDALVSLSAEVRKPMLVGAIGFEGLSIKPDASGGVSFDFKRRHNSVFLLESGRLDPVPYHKLELTPFGEVMPGIRRWPWLQQQMMAVAAGGMAFDLSPGDGPRVFDIGGQNPTACVTPICFEATKPALCRRLVRAAGARPVVIVNLTNDGWFGSFHPGRLQHLQIARWRCIELGVPMVRAANTGVSASIDRLGRVIASGIDGRPGAWNEGGVLTTSVVPSVASTLYARIGDWFGWSFMVVSFLFVGGAMCPRARTTKENQA